MKILIVLQIICALVSGFSPIRDFFDEINIMTEDLTEDLSDSMDDIENSASNLIESFETEIKDYKKEFLYVVDDFGNQTSLDLEIPDLNYFNHKPDLKNNVTFTLFDKRDGNRSFDTLKVNNETLLKNSRFNPKRPTVFITHGYMTSAKGLSVTLIRDAFLKKHDFNVITVSWNPLSVGSYVIARIMVIKVGKYIGKLINFLYKHGMNPNTTVLIGHSLGAHVMGFAGQTAKSKVHHLIGLDPALPLFFRSDSDQRISADDAEHVEIIHTDGGKLGSAETWGKYDFYPNGGSCQNGCENKWYSICSHSRAYEYLAEQIEEKGSKFVAVKCDSYKKFQEGKCAFNKSVANMGSLDKTGMSKGSYYLYTNTRKPFALGASQWAKISKRRLKNVFCK